MKVIKNAVCIIGEYTNRDGETKKQYLTIGKLFERDDSSLCLKLDSVPVNFDGWVNFYEPTISKAKKEIERSTEDEEIPFG